MLASGIRGATAATVLSFPVAVLALAVSVFGMPRPIGPGDHARLAAAARTLARDVATRESAEQQKLLADSGRGQSADVEFVQPQLVSWRTDGGAKHGSLSDIAGYYSELTRDAC